VMTLIAHSSSPTRSSSGFRTASTASSLHLVEVPVRVADERLDVGRVETGRFSYISQLPVGSIRSPSFGLAQSGRPKRYLPLRSISSIRYPSGSWTKQISEPPSRTRYGCRSGSIPWAARRSSVPARSSTPIAMWP
jgi:hypothetical protein